MSFHRLVEAFSIACVKCREPTELLALSEAVVRELGFDRLALVHGLWFRRSSPNLIRLDNFGEYADIFIEPRFYENDPALLACQRTNTVFHGSNGFTRAWQTFPSYCPPPRAIARDQLTLIYWPHLYVLKRLKQLGWGVSIHSQHDLDSCGFENEVIFEKAESNLIFLK